MLGIKHIKFDSMTFVLHYVNGKIRKEGRGLSFFYYGPNSSIVAIPLASNDLPFIFNETTRDYQTVSIQGQISYKISDPKVLADMLDFTVDHKGLYKKSDIEKLNQRIVNEAQTTTSTFIHDTNLKEAIWSGKTVEKKMESQVLKAENDRKLREMRVEADITIENQREKLIDQQASNRKKEADYQEYMIEATLKPYKEIDWRILTALSQNMDPKSSIALAFRQLAENAEKIGTLNISPDLLHSIINSQRENRK